MDSDFITLEMMEIIPANEVADINDSERPLVSVLMLAYNHSEFIKQAIASIINQETNGFTFEIIIGEDNSTDDTLDICKELQQKYPYLIRLIVSDGNVGMHRNFARLWIRAKGKYIAFCEGDDYWIDERKLLKQVQLLENHPDSNLCGSYTQSIKQNESGVWENAEIIRPIQNQDFYTFEEMIPRYNFHFSSVIVRKEAINFPCWFWNVYCVDRPLYLLATQKGVARLVPEITSVYRHHIGGGWSPLSWQIKANRSISLFAAMTHYFRDEHTKKLNKTLANILWFYMSEALKCKQIKTASYLYICSLRYMYPTTSYEYLQVAKVAIILFLKFPVVHILNQLKFRI